MPKSKLEKRHEAARRSLGAAGIDPIPQPSSVVTLDRWYNALQHVQATSQMAHE